MSHRFLLGTAALAVVVIGFAGYGILNMQTAGPVGETAAPSASTPVTPPAGTSTGTGEAPPAATGYTLAQVQAHSNANSCWSTINGKVYDLTSWINQHPGGPENILSICGSDGSAAFNAQHGGERQPAQELAHFYIGDLQ